MTVIYLRKDGSFKFATRSELETDKDINALLIALSEGTLKDKKKCKGDGVGDARIEISHGKSELHTNALTYKEVVRCIEQVRNSLNL